MQARSNLRHEGTQARKVHRHVGTQARKAPGHERHAIQQTHFKTYENSIFFDVHNRIDIKLLNRLKFNFSHLNEHKFRHNFQETVNPFYRCDAKTETTGHYLLRCPLFSDQRTKLLESLSNLNDTLLNHCDDGIVNILFYGSSKYSFSTNNKVLSVTIEFLGSTKLFDKPLFEQRLLSMDT